MTTKDNITVDFDALDAQFGFDEPWRRDITTPNALRHYERQQYKERIAGMLALKKAEVTQEYATD
jgi:hypothetical protein